MDLHLPKTKPYIDFHFSQKQCFWQYIDLLVFTKQNWYMSYLTLDLAILKLYLEFKIVSNILSKIKFAMNERFCV